jgi:hypothetical protein
LRDVRCPYCGGDNVVEVYEDERWYCLDCERYFDINEIIEMEGESERSELHYYEVKTFCPASRQEARITLANQKLINSQIVNGKPVECSLAITCKHKDSPLCYLKSIRLEAKGKRIQ